MPIFKYRQLSANPSGFCAAGRRLCYMSLEDQLLLSQHKVLRSDLDLLALAKAMLSKRQSPGFSTSVWLSQAQLTQKARDTLAKVKNFLCLLDKKVTLNQQPPRWDLYSLFTC